MKIFFKFALFAIIILGLIVLFFSFAGVLNSRQNLPNYVCIESSCFSVETVSAEAQLEKGLMYRKELDADKGMFFIFSKENIHPFWMKNTLIPLDIIWIDKNDKVVFIASGVQPCPAGQLECPMINSNIIAKYVLEINAGLSAKNGFAVGDNVSVEKK